MPKTADRVERTVVAMHDLDYIVLIYYFDSNDTIKRTDKYSYPGIGSVDFGIYEDPVFRMWKSLNSPTLKDNIVDQLIWGLVK